MSNHRIRGGPIGWGQLRHRDERWIQTNRTVISCHQLPTKRIEINANLCLSGDTKWIEETMKGELVVRGTGKKVTEKKHKQIEM